jgi:hypothetical protein
MQIIADADRKAIYASSGARPYCVRETLSRIWSGAMRDMLCMVGGVF